MPVESQPLDLQAWHLQVQVLDENGPVVLQWVQSRCPSKLC
jgi:hypothetical protein